MKVNKRRRENESKKRREVERKREQDKINCK